MSSDKNLIKMDAINRKILSIVHRNSAISNQDLASEVGLSPSACFQRYKAIKEAGLIPGFYTELDLDRLCEHVIAYVDFTLISNTPKASAAFKAAIEKQPEFMDCLKVTGNVDYICFTCCPNIQRLKELCDEMSDNAKLGIQRIDTRIVLERTKWYLGYPLEKLKWLGE